MQTSPDKMYRRYSMSSYRELADGDFDDCMNWLRQWFEVLTDGASAEF